MGSGSPTTRSGSPPTGAARSSGSTPTDGSVVATIKVGTRPNWIALGEDAVWVENTGDGTVMKIDPATNEVVGTFDVGRAPVYMAVVDGRLWVANGGERSVSVLDEATGDEVTRIGFETGVHGLGRGRRFRVGPRPPRAARPRQPERHDDLAVRPGNGYSVERFDAPGRRPYAAVPCR